MENGSKKYFIIFVLITGLIAAGCVYYIRKHVSPGTVPIVETEKVPLTPSLVPNTVLPENQKPTQVTDNSSPLSKLLNVPFTPQAPTANWDELHNEACEEASAIMVNEYFSGNTQTTLKPEFVESEIDKIVKWEQDNLGYHLDTTTEETAKFIREVYKLKTKVVIGVDEKEIKNNLNQGKLVIVSFDGRLLHNPNYKQPGPPHHMLVIRGYNSKGLITNDPGTRKGMNYSYAFSTLYEAAGDWSHVTNSVDLKDKKILIIEK